VRNLNVLDKTIEAVSPKLGAKRAEARSRIQQAETKEQLLDVQKQILKMISAQNGVQNSGYSHSGASKRRSWAKKYHSDSGSPKKDIEENRKLLRERTRDLAMNSPIGAAAIGSTRTNCVGSGLVPKPKIDYEFLGIPKETAHELQRKIKKEFALWAESSLCDNNDQNNFYELQQIAFGDWLKNGEEFCLIKYEKSEYEYMPYQLRLKLVEADRVCTPNSLDSDYDGYDKKAKNGNRIMNGIELSKDGKVVAYHICSWFPGEYDTGEKHEWTRVKKRGDKTGNPNILHIFNGERADQYRGVPFLAPVIETLKQITRYTEAEIMAALVNSMFVIFITTESGNAMEGFKGEDEVDEDDRGEDDEIEIGTGTVNELRSGEKVNAVESSHPNGNFDSFVNAMAVQVGAALEIAPEILLKKFTKNFSASKGAMNETWKSYRMRRSWFVNDFCQEIYELWFAEAVSKGRIVAPGFFHDPLVRKAYTNCTWNGPAQGQLDPGKEVDAAIKRVKEGFSTHEDECTALNGSDFEDNVRTLEEENRLLSEANREME
jgi:lambda family phage portal protein